MIINSQYLNVNKFNMTKMFWVPVFNIIFQREVEAGLEQVSSAIYYL